MNKMIARTALVATLTVSAMSLSACGTSNDCSSATDENSVTDSAAMFDTRAGGGHGTSHGTSHGVTGGNHGFVWPHWFGGSHSQQCPKPEPTSNS